MYENWVKYGLIVSPGNILSYATEYENIHYVLSIAVLILNVILITFFLELFTSKRKTHALTYVLHGINLSALLLIPLYINDPTRPRIII
jgi:inner membrane protein involved in colicin E2 resistance